MAAAHAEAFPPEDVAVDEPRSPAPTAADKRDTPVDAPAGQAQANSLEDVHIWGLKWRSSAWFITLVVAVGITTDILAYQIVIAVLPYRLQALNYTNVSGLTSWLLFAYSAGIFVSTFPVAGFFHRHPWRREPLIAAVIVLEGSMVLFMLARPYWAMVVARVLQGCSSTVVWTIGFSLICENVDPSIVGRQLGFAFSGVSVGAAIAPPIGGSLYAALGWHAPFIFVVIVLAADLAARMFIVEKQDIAKWRAKHGVPAPSAAPVEPALAAVPVENTEGTAAAEPVAALPSTATELNEGEPCLPVAREKPATIEPDAPASDAPASETLATANDVKGELEPELSAWQVLVVLATSPRGLVAFVLIFIFGLALGAQDPTFTLHVQSVWNKDSDFVGLLYLAAAVPSLIVGPLAGTIADRLGSEAIIVPSLVASVPFIPLLLLTNLPAYAVCFAVFMTFMSVINSAASLEMAVEARTTPGISEIHEFASLNVAFSLSSAIGAVIGGQMYDHLVHGWPAVVWFCFAIVVVSIPPPFVYSGNTPLLARLRGRRPTGKEDVEMAPVGAESAETARAGRDARRAG
ncbi:hypothetical protein Q5752_000704 [Cryptotrichosporon argae]